MMAKIIIMIIRIIDTFNDSDDIIDNDCIRIKKYDMKSSVTGENIYVFVVAQCTPVIIWYLLSRYRQHTLDSSVMGVIRVWSVFIINYCIVVYNITGKSYKLLGPCVMWKS